jgi:hypothetical protein
MDIYQLTMFSTAEKICLKFFLKRIKERNKDLKIRVVRLKFAIVCEKAFGDK